MKFSSRSWASRKLEHKAAAAAVLPGQRAQLPAEKPGKPPGEGQPQPQATGVTHVLADVDVEDSLDLALLDPESLVQQGKHHHRLLGGDLEAHGAALRRVIDGIAQQVDQDLLDPAGV